MLKLQKLIPKGYLNFWFEPMDPIRLDFFRRFFAFTFLVYMGARFYYVKEWLTSEGFHYTSDTKLWYHVDPYPLLPIWAIPIFGLVLFGVTGLLIVGKPSRIAAATLFGLGIYIQNADIVNAFTLNKFYIVFFGLLAVAPRPQSFTVADDSKPIVLQSAWPVRVIQATVIIQYFTAGTCKVMHGEWLQYPDILWSHTQGVYCTAFAALLLNVLPKGAWTLMMYTALAFEVFTPILFMVKRLRPLGFLLGIGFVTMIALTMYQLFFFSFQLLSMFFVFADDRFLHSVSHWFARFVPKWKT